MITSRTVYSYKGRDYNSITRIREAVNDEIGDVVNKLKGSRPIFTPGHLLKIHEFLLDNREVLVELLSIEFPEE